MASLYVVLILLLVLVMFYINKKDSFSLYSGYSKIYNAGTRLMMMIYPSGW